MVQKLYSGSLVSIFEKEKIILGLKRWFQYLRPPNQRSYTQFMTSTLSCPYFVYLKKQIGVFFCTWLCVGACLWVIFTREEIWFSSTRAHVPAATSGLNNLRWKLWCFKEYFCLKRTCIIKIRLQFSNS